MPYVDLHLHSNHSDGSDAPAQVVERAAALDILAIALTDHDAVSGVGEAQAAARERKLGFLTGTEVSTHFDGQEVHVLGLGIDIRQKGLCEGLLAMRGARNQRAEAILERLHALGIPIDPGCVRERARGEAVSRMHIAAELRAMGVTKSTQEGFDRFLNAGRPAYVPKAVMGADEAIAMIHAAGGLAFVAHPGLSKGLRRLLPRLCELPFDGIEAFHISHSASDRGDFLKFAESRRLLITGGSDCHGTIKRAPEMGKVRTPVEYYERILEALQAR